MTETSSLVDPATPRAGAVSTLRVVIAAGVIALGAAVGYAMSASSGLLSCSLLAAAASGATFAVIRFQDLRREARIVSTARTDLEHRMRRLADTLPVGSYVQAAGRIVSANPAMADLLRAPSAAALIGCKSITLYHPEDVETILAYRAEALSGVIPVEVKPAPRISTASSSVTDPG